MLALSFKPYLSIYEGSSYSNIARFAFNSEQMLYSAMQKNTDNKDWFIRAIQQAIKM